jgi:hypothetical protein
MSAAFFLQQTKTWASRIFLALSTILVLLSLVQASLDVASAVVFLRLPGLSGGSPEQAVLYKRLFRTRAALVAVNKYVHPLSSTPRLIPEWPAQSQIASLLVFEQFFFAWSCLANYYQLYRCAVIWASSPYYKVVIAIPAVLIISTLGMYRQPNLAHI